MPLLLMSCEQYGSGFDGCIAAARCCVVTTASAATVSHALEWRACSMWRHSRVQWCTLVLAPAASAVVAAVQNIMEIVRCTDDMHRW
jgi:hypothetical protein